MREERLAEESERERLGPRPSLFIRVAARNSKKCIPKLKPIIMGHSINIYGRSSRGVITQNLNFRWKYFAFDIFYRCGINSHSNR